MSQTSKPGTGVEYFIQKAAEAKDKAEAARDREKDARLKVKTAWEEEAEARQNAEKDWEAYKIRSRVSGRKAADSAKLQEMKAELKKEVAARWEAEAGWASEEYARWMAEAARWDIEATRSQGQQSVYIDQSKKDVSISNSAISRSDFSDGSQKSQDRD